MSPPSIIVRKSDFYDAVSRQIEHEGNLNVNRLSWLKASRSFLFSAYAVVVNGLVVTAPSSAPSLYAGQQDMLFRMIPMLGLISCAAIYVGLIAGAIALRRRRKMVGGNASDDTLPAARVSLDSLHPRRAFPRISGINSGIGSLLFTDR